MLSPVVSTLIFVMTLANVMSMAIYGSLRRAGIPGVNRWMIANLAFIAGLILFALRQEIPVFLSIIVANALLAYGAVLGYEGCRQFFHLPAVRPAPYACLAALLLGVTYWTLFAEDISARVAVISLFFASINFAIGYTTWKHRAPGRSLYGTLFVLATAWISALRYAVNGLVHAMGWADGHQFLQATPSNIGFLTVSLLTLPALSIGMVILAHDRMAERLEGWINVDDLTGALTRRGFFDKARIELSRATLSGAAMSIAILDLDHFKTINDRYGHAAGDQALAHFGRFIRTNLRESDLFCRVGGEEFAILFLCACKEDTATRLQTMQAALGANRRARAPADLRNGEKTATYTFSAGVDQYRHGESLEDLMRRADTALYSAKSQGRDRVVCA